MLPFTGLSSSEGIKGCMRTSRFSLPSLLAFVAVSLPMGGALIAQGPPPPLQPLLPPVAPVGNPITTDKTQLGKALFWDEQLSSTRTVACGTCHQPVAGGSDPRSTPSTLHPGPNGIFGNGDDIVGSPGVIASDGAGLQRLDDFFGMAIQVTGRYSPSAINAAYPPVLFWDGRATGTFTDPVSGEVVLAAGAALESQAAGPPTSSVEMAHAGRDWSAVASRLGHAVPLTLSPSVPADLSAWIAGRNYAQLFEAVFGSAGVTPSRIIMAIATYERSLVSNQAPFDAFIAGTPGALTAQEQQGLNLFRTQGCVGCHPGNRLTDDVFHYIGVRPQGEDPGRSAVTGVNGNRGQFKTPTLRNVALRGEYMHNGRFNSLAEVVDFYDRGGDFDAPNKPAVIRPLGLTEAEKEALVAFLGRPLTDPRVAAETGPFSRPALSAGTARSPVLADDAVADELGNLPLMTAVEPALAGSANFTVGLSRVPVGRKVWLVIDDEPIVSSSGVPPAGAVKYRFELSASGGSAWDTTLGTDHSGFASVALALPGGDALLGTTLHGKWFVEGENTFGESAAFTATVFGETAGLLAPPANLVARRDLVNSFVELSWAAVDGATRYDLYRSGTSVFSDAVFLASTAETGFSDESGDLVEGDYYWVVAVNADEAGGRGEAVKADGLSLDGFTIDAGDGDSTATVSVSWEADANLPNYRVLRGITDDPTLMTEVAQTAGASHSDPVPDPLRVYYYQVEKLDDNGTVVGRSLVDSGYRRLAAPEGLTASDSAHTDRIALSWQAVAGAVSYRVFRAVDGGSGALWKTVTETSTDDTDAPPGVTVAYTVQSMNAYGAGDLTTVPEEGRRAVTAPSGVTVTLGPVLGQLGISWDAVEGADGYLVYRAIDGDFANAVAIGGTATTEFIDENAGAGVSYHYWVAAVDNGAETVDEGISVAGEAGIAMTDLLVEAGSGAFLGDGIVNLSGGGQTRVARIGRWDRLTVRVRSENDGSFTDSMSYAGFGSNRCVRLTCLRTSPDVENLTAALKVGLAASGELDPGGSESLEIRLQPERGAAAKRKKRYQLSHFFRSISGLDPGSVDVAGIKVIAK